jgi:3-oxoacyl-[acyl-carrier-protein] synthase II
MAWTSGDDGIFLGTSYGDTDASAAFMARVFEKGPRLAPPAEFPNLVPSSPSGHASIYLKTHGPAISVPDLSTSGEAAIATAFELVASSIIEAATAGSAEGPSDIVAKGIAPIFRDASAPIETDRTEGSAVVRLMREPAPEVRAQLADTIVVRQVVQGHDLPEILAQIEPPYGKAAIVVPRIDDALKSAVAKTEWKNAKLFEIAPAIGKHEGLGGFAVAAAASLVVKRVVPAALAIGTAPGRAYAIFVDRVE